jgi:hypothetical protein
VTGREELELRRLVDQAVALKGTAYYIDACRAIYDWQQTRISRCLDADDARRAAALQVLRETTPIIEEGAVLRELRKVAVELCPDCNAAGCKHDPDCDFRRRVAEGMSERRAKWMRATEWRALIAARESRTSSSRSGEILEQMISEMQ